MVILLSKMTGKYLLIPFRPRLVSTVLMLPGWFVTGGTAKNFDSKHKIYSSVSFIRKIELVYLFNIPKIFVQRSCNLFSV